MLKIGGKMQRDDKDFGYNIVDFSELLQVPYKGFPTFMSWWNSTKILDFNDIKNKKLTKNFLDRQEKWKNIRNYDSMIYNNSVGHVFNNKITHNLEITKKELIKNSCEYCKNNKDIQKLILELRNGNDIVIVDDDFDNDKYIDGIEIDNNTDYTLFSVLFLFANFIYVSAFYFKINIKIPGKPLKSLIINRNYTIKYLKEKYGYDNIDINGKYLRDDTKISDIKIGSILIFSNNKNILNIEENKQIQKSFCNIL